MNVRALAGKSKTHAVNKLFHQPVTSFSAMLPHNSQGYAVSNRSRGHLGMSPGLVLVTVVTFLLLKTWDVV